MRNQQTEIKTGGIKQVQIDGKYKVWTKKIGNRPIKMLTLHGGPGSTHECFECFEDFLPQAGIEFYYYDQLGSAYSDQPKDNSLWTINRFRDEVEQVRTALGLENFYLYGHSWGGTLCIEYALKYQQHLKALIISNMTASTTSFLEYRNELIPPEVTKILNKYQAKGEYDAPEYQELLKKHLYMKHGCRVRPLPEPIQRMNRNYNYEVLTCNPAKHLDRWNDLEDIKVPTLIIGGRFDFVRPEDLQKMGRLISSSRTVICENGSHMSMYDDQETYFRELIRFVKDVEANKFSK